MTTLHTSSDEANQNIHTNASSSSSTTPFESRFLLRRPRPLTSSQRATSPTVNHSWNNSNSNHHQQHNNNTTNHSSCFHSTTSSTFYRLTLTVVVTLATLGTTSEFMELWISSSVIVGTYSSSSSSSSSRLQSLADQNVLPQRQQHHWTDPTTFTDEMTKASSNVQSSLLRSTAAIVPPQASVSMAQDATETTMTTTTTGHRPKPSSVAWKPRIVDFITMINSPQQWRPILDPRLSYPLKKQKEESVDSQMIPEEISATTPSSVTLFQDEHYWKECQPMAKWQSTSFPNCNALHEIQIAAEDFVLVSLQGSWRSVWKYYYNHHDTNAVASPDAVVVKLLKFEGAILISNRTNCIVPNIVHAFGFCGQSVITEAADDESAREYLKNTSLTSLDRLKIARDLARAMYHVHSIDYPNATNVTFVHNDVNMANLVQVQGRIKLNDFNIGVLQRWNTTSQSSICRSPVLFAQPLWKSPEEQPPPPHPNTPTAPSTLQFVENAAATDVYGLGNLLFQILTTRQPWTHLEPNGPLAKDQVVQLKRDGGRPYVPPEFSNSTDGAVQILYQVTMACFATNPNQRPTSFEAFRMLDGAAQSLETAAARESSKQ